MRLMWDDGAWEEYIEWQVSDKKILRRINSLIKDIQRTPFTGMGKPEPLKHDRRGWWSRRINDEHRLVYKVQGNDIIIASCKTHYEN